MSKSNQTKQKQIFRNSEGNQWYQRNKSKLESAVCDEGNDQVLASVKALRLQPHSILEIGCSNGWRLENLRQLYNAKCYGIDPSAIAIQEGKTLFKKLCLEKGEADSLPFENDKFDLVIFGFCLYLCDRDDIFKIAFEADRVLQEKGHIVILDFHPPFPYSNEYKHYPGLFSYKMNYANIFLWNPAYFMASQIIFNHSGTTDMNEPDDRLSVSILYKCGQLAYPENPFIVKKKE